MFVSFKTTNINFNTRSDFVWFFLHWPPPSAHLSTPVKEVGEWSKIWEHHQVWFRQRRSHCLLASIQMKTGWQTPPGPMLSWQVHCAQSTFTCFSVNNHSQKRWVFSWTKQKLRSTTTNSCSRSGVTATLMAVSEAVTRLLLKRVRHQEQHEDR